MQLLTFSSKSLSANANLGDIIGVFPDTHIFSPREYEIFDVVPTELTEIEINAVRPKYTKEEYESGATMPTFDLNYSNGSITANKAN